MDIKRYLRAAVAAAFFFLALARLFALPEHIAPAAAAREKLLIAYPYSSNTSGEEAQFMSIISEVLKIGLKDYAGGYSLTPYPSSQEMLRAVKQNKVDFTFTLNYDLAHDLLTTHKFKPIMGYSVYKKDNSKACIYVKKGSASGGFESMKGKRVSIQKGYRYFYYSLRKLAGARPDSYFKLVASSDEYSALYALALGKADGAFVNTVVIDYHKATNPGAVKNTVELGCAGEIRFSPVLASQKAPPGSADTIKGILGRVTTDNAFKNFRPLFKTASLKMQSVSAEEYAPLHQLYAEAKKKGWDKEYEDWMKYNAK